MMAQLMPNSVYNQGNMSRRSPVLRSEINSMKFDLGDDDAEKPNAEIDRNRH